ARADVAAEQIMAVVTHAAGDRQAFERRPVVLREQRPDLVILYRRDPADGAFEPEHAVVELAIDILAADHEMMPAAEILDRNVDADVERVLAAFELAPRPGQERIFGNGAALVDRQIGVIPC